MYPMIREHIRKKMVTLRKEGLSVKEIAADLGIAQSTVSLLVRDVVLDEKAKGILLEKKKLGRNKATNVLVENRIKRQLASHSNAQETLDRVKISKDLMFIIASVVYECEGGKSNFGVLEFTNSDPVLVSIFLSSLRQSFSLDESKFRVMMHLHGYHDEANEKRFWAEVTGIPESKFLKSFRKKESGINKKEGYRGCVQIKYFDVSIKRTLLASKLILAKKMGL